MKKGIALFTSLLLLFGLLAGCGKTTSATGSTKAYAEAITAARSEEDNQVLPIVTSVDDAEYEDTVARYGFNPEDMQRFAFSISSSNIRAYGLIIVLPAEGRRDAVMEQMDAYIDARMAEQERYLPDQYAIASGALVDTAPTGEILLAMCEDPSLVMDAMKSQLKG